MKAQGRSHLFFRHDMSRVLTSIEEIVVGVVRNDMDDLGYCKQ